ncbi:MAG: sulfite exporter TauE/SafE family protein [Bdellovibrionaceae bacterium]|nr:sulfite exporter TauE/SafE family protein [Pseudobdellovibrionaceae bacterium]
MEFNGYFASILMGLTLGLIGGGGSILTVPILVYLFSIVPTLATTYSLFIVGLTAFFGGLRYYKKGEVDLKTAFLFAIPSFSGVYLTRHFLLPALPDPVFDLIQIPVSKSLLIMVLFSILMVFASFSMIKEKKQSQQLDETGSQQKILLVFLKGLFVGGVTGFVGAGGGFLIIPALVLLIGLPMRRAVGTSLSIIAFNSLLGFIGDIRHQVLIDWKLLMTLSTLALLGLQLGIRLNNKIPEKTLKKNFGYFVLIMGSLILFDQIRRQIQH